MLMEEGNVSQDLPRIQSLTPERSRELAADPDRRRLLDQMMYATTRDEIDAARRAQRAWLMANPDDFGVLDAGEELARRGGANGVSGVYKPG